MYNKIIFACSYIVILMGLINSIDKISIPNIPLNNNINLIVNNSDNLHNLDKNNSQELTELNPNKQEELKTNESEKNKKDDKNFIDPYDIKDPPYNR